MNENLITAIIVDDEAEARDIIESLVLKAAGVNVIGKYENATIQKIFS